MPQLRNEREPLGTADPTGRHRCGTHVLLESEADALTPEAAPVACPLCGRVDRIRKVSPTYVSERRWVITAPTWDPRRRNGAGHSAHQANLSLQCVSRNPRAITVWLGSAGGKGDLRSEPWWARKLGEHKARPEGFEPPTHCLEGSCSHPLSYGRLLTILRHRDTAVKNRRALLRLHPHGRRCQSTASSQKD